MPIGQALLAAELAELAVGIFVGFIASLVYSKTPLPYTIHRKDTFMEHYIWGLLLIDIYALTWIPLILGAGIALIIEERFQDNPFAIGKPTFIESTAVSVILLVVLALILYFHLHICV